MAIIIGLEEKERILKSIEEKIKEVEELQLFLTGLESASNTLMLTCVDNSKKRYRISVKGNFHAISAFIKEKREELTAEITVLCKANAIALNETERKILGIEEKVEQEADIHSENIPDMGSEAFADNAIYAEDRYSNE